MKKQTKDFAKAQYQTPCVTLFDVKIEGVIANSLEQATGGDSFYPGQN